MKEFFANKKLYSLDAITRVVNIFKKEKIAEVSILENDGYYLLKIENISGEEDSFVGDEFGNFVIAEMKNRKL